MEPFSQDKTLTRIFKTSCLNACSKFVKDATQLVMQFPEMTEEQAQFLYNVVKPGTEGNSVTEDSLGFRSMYAPLWQSMREFSFKYDYRIDYDNLHVTKDGMKRVVFEKIPKTKKWEPTPDPDIVDVDALDDDEPQVVNTSNVPIRQLYEKIRKKQLSRLTDNDKLVKRVANKMRKGTLSAQFVHYACQKVSEFVMDDEKCSLVFKDLTFKDTQFIDSLPKLACNTLSYMLFTSDCQRYLDDIAYSYNVKKVRYFSVRDKENKTFVLQKTKKPAVVVGDSDSVSMTSESTIDSGLSTTSKLTRKEFKSVQDFTAQLLKSREDKLREKLAPKMKNGSISLEFVETTLARVMDFFDDEEQGSVLFKDPTKDEQVFLQSLRQIVRKQSLLDLFDVNCRSLLASIGKRLEANRQYQMIQMQGGRDFQFMRLPDYRSQNKSKKANKKNKIIVQNRVRKPIQLPIEVKPIEIRTQENPIQVQNNIISNQTRQPPPDIEELIKLKAVIYDVLKHSGDQAVADFLSDISNFLTAGNTDRSLTFDDLTKFEVTFVKHVHVASKNDDVYPMFSRDCQKLLRSIRFNAQNYKLTVKMIMDETRNNCWTLILEKQTKPATPPKVVVQHRARSLSAGRRVAQLVANLKIERIPRGSSGQRPKTVKEKLKAALAQPVQSDKALKMMQSMGWKGGALGARGDGITEPIALPLDLVSRAGLGHIPPVKKTKEPKPKEPKSKKNQKQDEPTKDVTDVTSKEWMRGLVPPGILPAGIEPAPKSETIILQKDYRYTVLRCILVIINTDVDVMYFVSTVKSPEKVIGFIRHAVQIFNMRGKFILDTPSHVELVQRIQSVLAEHCEIELNAELKDNDVVVKKTKLIPISRKRRQNNQDGIKLTDKEFNDNDNVITKEDNREQTNDVIDLTNQESTSNDTTVQRTVHRIDLTEQETSNKNNTTALENKENTDNIIDLTLESQETRASRPWYFPVKKKNRKPEIITQVPALQALALSKVFEAINQIKYDGLSKETANTLVQKEKAIDLTEGDNKTIQEDNTNNSQVVEKDEDMNMTVEMKENNMLQLSTDVAANTIQSTENPNGPGSTPLSNPNEHENMETEEANNIVDPQIVNETAIAIQKALEKILPIPKTKENASSSNHKDTEASTKLVETKVQKPAQVKTLVKNIKIPNMTRKQLALLKEHGVVPDDESQKTTYRLKVEEYKIDKVKSVDVKVNKYTTEMALNEAKRRRMKKNLKAFTTASEENVEVTTASEEIVEEVRKTPGMILLEKLMVTNNNDSTKNKNKAAKKKKSSGADRLVNAVSFVNELNDKKSDNSNITSLQLTNNNDSNKPVSKSAPVVNKVAPMMKFVETADLTEDEEPSDKKELTIDTTEVICIDNAKTSVNVKETTKVMQNSIIGQNKKDTESFPYIVPVECDKKTEVLTDAKNNMQDKRKIVKAVRKNEITNPNDGPDDDDSQIVKDNSVLTVANVKKTLTNKNTTKKDAELTKQETVTQILPVKYGNKIGVLTDNKDTTEKHTTDTIQDKRKIIKAVRKSISTNSNCVTAIDDGVRQNIKDYSVSTVIINSKDGTVLLTPNTKIDLNKESTPYKKNDESVSEPDNTSDQFYDSTDVLIENEKQPTCTKRQSMESVSSDNTPKKCKLPFYKRVVIQPKNYPQTFVDNKKAREIQSAILESIDYTKETLPILKCQGIQNGCLVYDCQDEKSLSFLEGLVKTMSELKLTFEMVASEKSTHKMAFRINSFVEEPVFEILNRLEMYSGLNASNWFIFKKENHKDFRVIYVEMDELSFDHVCYNNFVLYAGNDCARFSFIWD